MEIPDYRNVVEIDASSPFYLNSNDSPDDVLVSMKLTGDNCSEWSQAILIALHAKNKFGFIDGQIPKPYKDDADFRVWKRVNEMVLSWLLNTMSKDLIPTNISTESAAAELWNDLLDRFSPNRNIRLFYLLPAIPNQRQGNDSLLIYFNKMKKFWHDLSVLLPNGNNHIEQVMQFLAGLDESYAWFRSQVLSGHPLPQIDEIYSWILDDQTAQGKLNILEVPLEDSAKEEIGEPQQVLQPIDGGNEEIDFIDGKFRYVHSFQSNFSDEQDQGLSDPQASSAVDSSSAQTGSETGSETRVQIEHLSHNHPLVYTEYSHKTKKDAHCSSCQAALFGPIIYSCEECKFDLHQVCAEAPQEPVNYAAHLEHMLNFQISSSSDDGSFNCDACFDTGRGFNYYCSLCDYILHIECALNPKYLAHESHPHVLSLEMMSGEFSRCDRCYLQCSGGLCYSCSWCKYYLHTHCASVPYSISYKMLDDDANLTLKLAYSTKFDVESNDFRCSLCDHNVDENWFYYSSNDPRIFVHVLCGLKRATGVPLDSTDTRKPNPCKKMQTISRLKESKSKTITDTDGGIMKPYWSDHAIQKALVPIDESERSKSLCNWCQQLLSGTSYGCKNCELYVHKLCYESPEEIRHPFHPHKPMTLVPRVLGLGEWCQACDNRISGTAYCCHYPCYKFLLPQCALLPQQTTFEGHIHKSFNLIYKIKEDGYFDKPCCDACEGGISETWAYRCAHCDYTVHMACMVPSALRRQRRSYACIGI